MYLRNRTRLRLVVLSEDSAPDDRLAEWSRSFYGVGVWLDVLAPHWTTDNGYKNWIGNKTTDFVARAHAHGLKVSDDVTCCTYALNSHSADTVDRKLF